MAKENSKVRVKMSVGDIDFEIECGVDELRDVVDKILASVSESGISEVALSKTGEKRRSIGISSHGVTCKGVISELWGEGWFQLGRTLGEVHGEMGRRGFHYDRTAVAHALVDLVREGLLTREGRPRRYRYLQKRPSLIQNDKN